MALFLSTVLSIWALMHAYVFWRLSTIPCLAARFSWSVFSWAGFIFFASYPLARIMSSRAAKIVSVPLEFLAANWIGVLFLLFSSLLVTDVLTLGGWLFPRDSPMIRGWAATLAVLLSIIALAQGLRGPVLRDYEVTLAGLSSEQDGLVLVALSDLHLGTLIGKRWLERLVARVDALHPDLLVIVGDVVDGNAETVKPLVPLLRKFHAPLGVWAVTGNHDYYAGFERSIALFEAAGFSVLRDSWARIAPNLVLAGVDDLTARAQFGEPGHPVEKALKGRPAGATILLSHSPMQIEAASNAGVGLVLCGHTHHGQIWPFNFLVASRYPLIGGRYQIGGMTVIVSRGAGTWGPRMRLWWPSEIVRIRLRAAPKG